MKSLTRIGLCVGVLGLAPAAFAQGRGAAIWTTTSGDAARSASMRTDVRISRESLGKPGFQLLWKRQLDTQASGLAALTQPVFGAPGFITYKGFKGLAYVGAASDTVHAVDYDLNRMFWTRKLPAGSPVAAAAPGCTPGMAVTLTSTLPPAPVSASGRGAGPGAAGAGGGGGGLGGPARGAVAALYSVSTSGMLHSLNLQTGTDWFPPARMLPAANATISGAVLVSSVMYVATAGNCGGVPNGVYAMDLTPPDPPLPNPDAVPSPPNATPVSSEVTRWETRGASVVGGPAFASDGTLFVSTGDGPATAAARSNAVVALQAKTLVEKDYFSPGGTPFTTAPVTFTLGGKEIVAAGNAGRIYLLDAAALGGPDHKTPLATSLAATRQTINGLATVDDNGTRWLVMSVTDVSTPTPKHFVAGVQVTMQNGTVSIAPSGWMVPLLSAPATPAIANGVVFVVATGRTAAAPLGDIQARTAVAGTTNATLYAVDLRGGQELWNSGTAIASPAIDAGPAVDDGQVYVETTDGTLYAFGFVVER